MDRILLVRTVYVLEMVTTLIYYSSISVGVSALKLRRNANENDERTVIMVNELRDTLRGDMIIISAFNKERIEDTIFNLCVE